MNEMVRRHTLRANCSICSRNAKLIRGLCPMHYQCWRRHGDPLLTTETEPARFFREVVLTDERGPDDPCLIWPYATRRGYGCISIDGRMHVVSRDACEARHGPPPTPKHQAAHNCGKGRSGCVTKSHLDWKTQKENLADRLEHGTDPSGARNPFSKLTENDVREIRTLRDVRTRREIAAAFKISERNVYDILSGKRWGTVT